MLSPELGADLIKEAKEAFPRVVVPSTDLGKKETVSQGEPAQRPYAQAGRSVVILRNRKKASVAGEQGMGMW